VSARRPALPLAVTLGEPAGIGPEITLAAWLMRESGDVPPFYVHGDPALFAALASQLGHQVPIAKVTAEEAFDTFWQALPVIALDDPVSVTAGKPDPANAPAVLHSIERSVADIHAGKAAAIVTNPIQKKSLYDAGFRHPGHTEFLGALAEQFGAGRNRPVMMLAGPELRTVPVTVHIPLKDVPSALTTDLIVETARIVADDLVSRFGIANPRLALAGLNPHAGEGGSLGLEDDAIIRPAAEQLQTQGIDASGPLPADTLFHAEARSRFDVVLGMYHDQALIPVKTLAFDETVNVTLGLPFVRTSPDHGTALDVAGKGLARPTSLIAAMKMAGDMADAAHRTSETA